MLKIKCQIDLKRESDALNLIVSKLKHFLWKSVLCGKRADRELYFLGFTLTFHKKGWEPSRKPLCWREGFLEGGCADLRFGSKQYTGFEVRTMHPRRHSQYLVGKGRMRNLGPRLEEVRVRWWTKRRDCRWRSRREEKHLTVSWQQERKMMTRRLTFLSKTDSPDRRWNAKRPRIAELKLSVPFLFTQHYYIRLYTLFRYFCFPIFKLILS